MTPESLIAWRKRLGMNRTKAAKALGIGLRSLLRYEHGEVPIPPYIGLACAAVAYGLKPVP